MYLKGLNNMYISKQFICDFPFPVISLDMNIKYSGVERPTGIEYMLLVLIHEGKNKNEKLRDILNTFGVSYDAQFLFERVMASLYARGILRMNNCMFNIVDFDNYTLNDFIFTEDGERIFSDGYIPTGNIEIKPAKSYYETVDSEFKLISPDEKSIQNKFKELENSTIYNDGFVKKIDKKYDILKDFCIKNQKKLKLDDKERVIDVEVTNEHFHFFNYPEAGEVNISNNGIEMSFKEYGENLFFKSYFTPKMLEKELAAEFKHSFEVKTIEDGFDSFEKLNTVYEPKDYKKLKGKAGSFLIETEQNEKEKQTVIRYAGNNNYILKNLPQNCVDIFSRLKINNTFIALSKDSMTSISPVHIKLNEKNLTGKIFIDLVVEELWSDEDKDKLIHGIFHDISTEGFTEKIANLVNCCSDLSKNIKPIDYIKSKFDEAETDYVKAKTLETSKKVFKDSGIAEFVKNRAKQLYDGLMSGLTYDNVSSKLVTLGVLIKLAGDSDSVLLRDITEKLNKENSQMPALFNFLKNSGFNENDVLRYVNIIEYYSDKVLKTSTDFEPGFCSDDFKALGKNLQILKDLLGIENVSDYTLKENPDVQKLKESFNTYRQILKQLQKFKNFAEKQFEELAKYQKIVEPVYTEIIRSQTISYAIITAEQLKQLMKSGKYDDSILNLAKRLELILKTKLSLQDSKIMLGELLGILQKDYMIDNEILKVFQQLNDWRIVTVHPVMVQNKCTDEAFEKAVDAVFNFERSELRSKR
jgi:hypothetical protein